MAKITVNTISLSEATKTLRKVYEFDRSSVYGNDDKTVHGNVILASIVGLNVQISSNYYSENTLIENFAN